MKIIKKIVLGMAVLTIFPWCSHAENVDGKPDWAPDVTISDSFATKYIWRGWNLGDQPVMQLDAAVSKWGFTFDWWANYSFNDEKDRDSGRYQEFTEIDYTLDYTANFGDIAGKMGMEPNKILDPLSFSAGYIYYTFPNVDWEDKYFDTHEVYAGVSYDCLLSPSFKWYWDVDSGKGNTEGGGDGSYFVAGIGHTFEFGESGISADLGLSAAYNDEQWTDKRGWADMVFSGGVNIPVFKYFTVRPYMNYSLILDRDTYNDTAENEFFGGIKLSFAY